MDLIRRRPACTENRLAFFCEPRGPLPNDGLYRPTGRKSHQTGEPWYLLYYGGKTPANPHVTLRPCAHSEQSERDSFPEPEGLSPDGGLSCSTVRWLYQTREPRDPLPSGGKTPANPHVSLRPCAHGAQKWVQGFSPAAGRPICVGDSS